MTPRRTCDQINALVRHLVEVGLADDLQYAFERKRAAVQVTFDNSVYVVEALKGAPYEEVYELFAEERAFNLKLLDGALVQMEYLFVGKELAKHRLAFLPSPHLEPYERDPEIYDEDHTFAEIVGRRVIAVPLRFDFDSDDGRHVEVEHPKSHLTLGEYQRCRIPVRSPVTPRCFMEFLLRHFYRTRDRDFTAAMPHLPGSFERCTTLAEEKTVHVVVA